MIFNFPIVKFPLICGNITATSAYRVYSSQLIIIVSLLCPFGSLACYLIFKRGLRLSAHFNRTDIVDMTISVSGGLDILCIIFKIIVFFITTLFDRLYVGVTHIGKTLA